jgi:outer membrane protein TolC
MVCRCSVALPRDRVEAAEEAERPRLNPYEAATVDYTPVITAQTNSLNNQQTALSMTQSRILASVSLIQALGCGWEASELPPGS